MSKAVITDDAVTGVVLYTDGSFRHKRGGWGVHGYTYTQTPLSRGIGIKQLPTSKGYAPVKLPDTVTPIDYIDGFGSVVENPTNNTGELQAAIEAFRLANRLGIPHLHILMDSEYVLKGLTKWAVKWKKAGWVNPQGEPVANRAYWEVLCQLHDDWKAQGHKVILAWVKGHSGDVGNDIADVNARIGSGGVIEPYFVTSPAEGYHNAKPVVNPLFMKSRMMFGINGEPHHNEKGVFYYQYQLGRLHNYGHKQDDTKLQRLQKTDLLLGRRLSDATFCVVCLDTPDTYLDQLMTLHCDAHQRDVTEIGIARLDVAYKPAIYQRVGQLGGYALTQEPSIRALLTPNDELVTKTLDPALLARSAIDTFTIMERQLVAYKEGKLGKKVKTLEITDALYETREKGKQKDIVAQLKPAITNQLETLDVPVTYDGHDLTLRLVLGVDIPQRNALARLADPATRVVVLIVAEGPHSYTFSTLFDTPHGHALYASPYTRFVIPKPELP